MTWCKLNSHCRTIKRAMNTVSSLGTRATKTNEQSSVPTIFGCNRNQITSIFVEEKIPCWSCAFKLQRPISFEKISRIVAAARAMYFYVTYHGTIPLIEQIISLEPDMK